MITSSYPICIFIVLYKKGCIFIIKIVKNVGVTIVLGIYQVYKIPHSIS